MDLRGYYKKIRQTEASIAEPCVVVVSKETPEGGRAGVKSEVLRAVAAKLIVEGKVELASAEEAAQFRAEMAEKKQRADDGTALTGQRVPVAVITAAELRALKSALKPEK